jgi:flagellar biosynthesis/type III secretory pathway protein FliH
MATTSMMLEWKAEGRAEGFAEGLASGMQEARREDLIKLLRVKFHALPPELAAAVRGTTDLERLTRWFDAALAAPTLEGFAVLIRDL